MMSEEVTDNADLSESAKRYDFITVPSVGFVAEVKKKTASVIFSYLLGYSRYERNPDYDAFRHQSEFKGYVDITRATRLEFDNSFLITEDPNYEFRERFNTIDKVPIVPQRRVTRQETIRRDREKYLTNASQMKLTHEFNKTDSISLAYGLDVLRNEDPAVRNEVRHRPSLTANYWPVPGRLSIEGRLDYENTDISSSTEDPGYTEESIVPSLEVTYWVVPRQFSITSGLTYEKGLSYEDGPAALNDNWNERFRPSAGFWYDFTLYRLSLEGEAYYDKVLTFDDDGMTDPSDDFTLWHGRLRVTRRFTQKLRGFLEYAHEIKNYKGTDEEDQDVGYTLYEPSIGFSYTLPDDIPLACSVGLIRREKKSGASETGFTLNGQAGPWRFARRGTLRLKVASGYDADDVGAERLGGGFYYDALSLASYRFSEYFAGDIFGSYRKDRFIDDKDLIRDDKARVFGAGLTYQPRKWWYARLDFSHLDVTSTEEENSYRENRVTLRILWAPERAMQFY